MGKIQRRRFYNRYQFSVVYRIFNKNNNKSYIGSTLDFDTRKYTHTNNLKRNKHHSKKMQNDYNLGHDFCFEILHIIQPLEYMTSISRNYKDRKILLEIERAFIKKYDSIKNGYNSDLTAHFRSKPLNNHSIDTNLKRG